MRKRARLRAIAAHMPAFTGPSATPSVDAIRVPEKVSLLYIFREMGLDVSLVADSVAFR